MAAIILGYILGYLANSREAGSMGNEETSEVEFFIIGIFLENKDEGRRPAEWIFSPMS